MAIVDCVVEVDSPGAQAVTKVILGDDSEAGGSRRVDRAAMEGMLAAVSASGAPTHQLPGGSAANVLRALAALGERGRIIGCRGDDADGDLFSAWVSRAGIEQSALTPVPGTQTGSCLVLNQGRLRTMRTCFDGCARLDPAAVRAAPLGAACQWLFCAGYCLYVPGLLEAALEAAQAQGKRVALDLGSFEIVRAHHAALLGLFRRRLVDVVVCNEDEALAFLDGLAGAGDAGTVPGAPGAGGAGAGEHRPVLHAAAGSGGDDVAAMEEGASGSMRDAVRACHELSRRVGTAVVTLGAAGCVAVATDVGTGEVTQRARVDACPVGRVVDTTGAGDAFSAGLLKGLLEGKSLADSARVGCAAGGACVMAVGARLSEEGLDRVAEALAG